MELTAGTMVTKNVRLVRLLGEGGMGGVWVADHLTLETQVAVKFISPEVAKKEGKYVLDRFEREAKAAAKLKSPHVVRAYDYGIMLGDVPYLVMELLEGRTLADRLEQERTVPPATASRIVTQTARALQEAHDLGIVHRDIKPENIFLLGPDDELHVKVLDFGIAKQPHTAGRQALTGTHTMIGTPLYMSPEQLLTPKLVGLRSDLWSLAVVAYEMLTGDAPFSGETLAALSLAICNRPHPPPTELEDLHGEALTQWFDQALAKDPEERFGSAKEQAKALAEICAPAARSRSRSGDHYDTTPGRPPAISAAWSRDDWMLRSRAGGEPTGPVCLAEVDQAMGAGTIPSEAMLAPVGSSDWRRAVAVLNHARKLATAFSSLASLPEPVSDDASVDESELETNVSVPYGNTVVSAGQAPRAAPSDPRASAPSLDRDEPSVELAETAPVDPPILTPVPSAPEPEASQSTDATPPLAGSKGALRGAGLVTAEPQAPPGRAAATPAVATFSGASTSTSSTRSPRGLSTGLLLGIGGAAVLAGFVATILVFQDDETEPATVQPTQTPASASAPAAPEPSAQPLPPPPEGMVAVGGGTYPVGCDQRTHRNCFPDEGPVHQVAVRPFAIMRHEVTVEDYDACVATGVCPPAAKSEGCNSGVKGAARQPINCVSWSAGTTYCAHHGWRLPTEVEWEVAARGPQPQDFPWGKGDPTCDLTAMATGSKSGCGTSAPLDVGSRPKDVSWVGALDMAGNVREWTASDYRAYPGGEADPSRGGKTNRGGSYVQKAKQFAALHTRGVDRPDAFRPGLGFRCAKSL